MTQRYRILLVEDPGGALVLRRRRRRFRRRPPEQYPREALGLGVLLEAIERLRRQGPGPCAWRTSFCDDPIAFILDSISDALVLRDEKGKVLYANNAAHQLGILNACDQDYEEFYDHGIKYFRRSMRYQLPNQVIVIEVASRLS